MFRNTFQSGFLTILYSLGSKPLQIWDKNVTNGHIKRVTDNDLHSMVLEVAGTNVNTTYISCPADPKQTLGIKLPFLVMIIKNLKENFTFEVQVLDDENVRRRFRFSNYRSRTQVSHFMCTMPIGLEDGWSQNQFDLSDFTRKAYGTNYIETLRVQIHGSCRIRRVYFSDGLYSEDQLPAEFKLYLPFQNQKADGRRTPLRVTGGGRVPPISGIRDRRSCKEAKTRASVPRTSLNVSGCEVYSTDWPPLLSPPLNLTPIRATAPM
ncbi:Cilia- and flagella-associated protein 20 [Scophthalmus maximus]|uniref:Cilia-and flagella-associated protein 20 n=1 Tax=Scophthalmus maximus TaxID=52904 RepID=A0A2U9CXM5_SCOMX|nr:cilia- and flagella-associated protein 20-like isoform X2 [Scophthalmus maximus]AWP21307.1 Cilia- and flagella-associated protein 20 [Scophthalmus maximus]